MAEEPSQSEGLPGRKGAITGSCAQEETTAVRLGGIGSRFIARVSKKCFKAAI